MSGTLLHNSHEHCCHLHYNSGHISLSCLVPYYITHTSTAVTCIIIQVTFHFHVWCLTTLFTSSNVLITAIRFSYFELHVDEGNVNGRKSMINLLINRSCMFLNILSIKYMKLVFSCAALSISNTVHLAS